MKVYFDDDDVDVDDDEINRIKRKARQKRE